MDGTYDIDFPADLVAKMAKKRIFVYNQFTKNGKLFYMVDVKGKSKNMNHAEVIAFATAI